MTEQVNEQVTKPKTFWTEFKARQDELLTELTAYGNDKDAQAIADGLQHLADEAKALANATRLDKPDPEGAQLTTIAPKATETPEMTNEPSELPKQTSPYSETPKNEPQPNTENRTPNTAPQIGDHVLYKLDRGPNTGDYRPAIIVRTWSGGAGVNMLVFTDCINDDIEKVFWAVNRVEGDKPGCWSRYLAPSVGAVLVAAQEPTPTYTAEPPPQVPTAAQQPEPAKPPGNNSNPRAAQPQPGDPDHRSSP